MESFKEVYNDLKDDNMHLIYNYINKDLVIKKSDGYIYFRQVIGPKFVTVCRLVEQKAIDRLIKVHSRLIKEGYQHNFYIIGDGPEKDKLKEMIKHEQVENTFQLLGKKENPYPYIKNADYFCLLSYFEGYGMVLEEAKILNKKIIITDTAARECIQNYEYCSIVDNNEKAIYDVLKDCIFNKNDREKQEVIPDSTEEHDRQIQFEKAEEFEELRKILEENREKEKERFER